MTCREAQERLPDLFDCAAPCEGTSGLLAHLADCPACAGEYGGLAAVMASIQAPVRVRASAGFKERVLAQAMAPEPRANPWTILFPALAAAATVLVLAVAVVRPVPSPSPGAAAAELLEQSAAAMSGIRSLHVTARMLAGGAFTPVEMWSRAGNIPQSRVETSSWAQWMDKGSSTEYYKDAGLAVRRRRGVPLFWASALLDPDKSIREELEAVRGGASTATLAELDRDGIPELLLTIRRKSGGSLPADLLRSEGAAGPDQTRFYRFDPATRRLIGMRVVLDSPHGELVVFEIDAIHYDEPVNQEIFRASLPRDVIWTVNL